MVQTNINTEKLAVGDYLSEIQYYKVIKVNPKTVALIDDKGKESTVDKELIALGMHSASQYTSEKVVTRTEIKEILEQAGNNVFTVNFNKQVKDKEVKDKLLNAIKNEEGNPLSYQEMEKALKKVSKHLMEGEERTLIGHLYSNEPQMGRTQVIDLEIPIGEYRVRQVDHRTINWLIIKNVKYIVK